MFSATWLRSALAMRCRRREPPWSEKSANQRRPTGEFHSEDFLDISLSELMLRIYLRALILISWLSLFYFISSCPAIGLMIRDQYANYVVQVIIQMRRIYWDWQTILISENDWHRWQRGVGRPHEQDKVKQCFLFEGGSNYKDGRDNA